MNDRPARYRVSLCIEDFEAEHMRLETYLADAVALTMEPCAPHAHRRDVRIMLPAAESVSRTGQRVPATGEGECWCPRCGQSHGAMAETETTGEQQCVR